MLEIHAAEAPITEDDDFIAAALESASIPTLMMALIHVTGDTSLLDGPIRPGPAAMGGTQGGYPSSSAPRCGRTRSRRSGPTATAAAGCPRRPRTTRSSA